MRTLQEQVQEMNERDYEGPDESDLGAQMKRDLVQEETKPSAVIPGVALGAKKLTLGRANRNGSTYAPYGIAA